jgi:hypothetical protein
MMDVRTPGMPATPRVGRSGRGLGFGLRRPPPRVARAHNAVYAWICKPILAAGQAPATGSTSSRRWRTPCSIRARAIGGPAPRRSTCPLGWVEEIGRQLSERSCATASAVAGSLSKDVLALAPAERHSGRRNTPIGGGTPAPHPSPRSPPTGGSSAPKPDDVTSAENMGATCRSELPPTSRRTSANIATLDGSHRSLRLR